MISNVSIVDLHAFFMFSVEDLLLDVGCRGALSRWDFCLAAIPRLSPLPTNVFS